MIKEFKHMLKISGTECFHKLLRSINDFKTSIQAIVSENIFFDTNTLLISHMSAFFCKKMVFLGKNSAFTQSNSMRAILQMF